MFQITSSLDLQKVMESPNVMNLLTEKECEDIGKHIYQMFEMDRQTRTEWEQKMAKASKIALQVVEQKSFPWPGASNVKFPLLTIACLQYHSRAYPALVDSHQLVKYTPVGIDPKSQSYQASLMIGDHMSWQLLEEDEQWESEMDKTLLVQSLMGCCFKKTYFDPVLAHNVSECVLPQDLVVSYYTKSLETAPRITHILQWDQNKLMEEKFRKTINVKDIQAPKTMPVPFGELAEIKDQAQGMHVSSNDPEAPFIILEQHNWMDLDADGYKEPYVCLVRYDTQELLAIHPRFLESGLIYEDIEDQKTLVKIVPEHYFTKFPFIPSPDGSFYDLGFGSLLGPLNESINTSINQLFDAGTLKNAGGGFFGKGVRTKSGEISIRPSAWIRVDSVGTSLKDNILPLPVPEPSPVLLQLLSLLIDYGQRVAGAPDIIQGQNPGQNTPAETSRNMAEQGMKVFSGIYKRTYRAFRQEIRNLYRLNQLYLNDQQAFTSPRTGFPVLILKQIYELPPSAVRPASDPYYISDAMRMQQASALMQVAHTMPGYNLVETNRNYLRALHVESVETYYPGPDKVPPLPNPKVQIEQMKSQIKQMDLKLKQQQAEQKLRMEMFKLMEEHSVNQANIIKIEAEAAKALAEAGGIKEGHDIAKFEALIGAEKAKLEAKSSSIKMLHELVQSLHQNNMDIYDQGQEDRDAQSQQKLEERKISASRNDGQGTMGTMAQQ